MRTGDKVVLYTPDNPRLDGADAIVAKLTSWGAHVTTEAAATGKFRALISEMSPMPHTPTSSYSEDPCCNCGGMRMRRAGACRVCEDCGTSEGCG